MSDAETGPVPAPESTHTPGPVFRDRGVIIATLIAENERLKERLGRQATLLAACRGMTPEEFNAQPDMRPECPPGTHSMMTWHGLPAGPKRICWDCDYEEQLP